MGNSEQRGSREEIIDAEFVEIDDAVPNSANPSSQTEAPPQPAKGWWRRQSLPSKVGWIVGPLLLLAFCTSGDPAPQDDAETASAVAPAPVAPTAEQMFRDWLAFVTGESNVTEFAITDGTTKLGQFCSASNGTIVMAFGGPAPQQNSRIAFDDFAKLDGPTNAGIYGSFWFDRAGGKLLVRRLIQTDLDTDKSKPAPDTTMKVEATSPGFVRVNGKLFHTCIR